MSVTLRKRKNADGSISLRLDIYKDGKHTIETLKHLKLSKTSTIADRENNKELLKKAESIKLARAVELEGNNYNLSNDFGKKTKVLDWMQSYIDVYTKKDKRNMVGVKNRFELFLNERKLTELTFGNLTPILIEEFIDYLESKSIGEGARSYFNRFKKMIRYAYRKKILQENILDLIERKVKGKARRKDTLTLEEIKTLSNTPIKSDAVKRAFLFSCFTGLRWVDIKSLKWDSIYIENDIMYIRQSKTQVDLSAPLNEVAKKQLGKKGKLSDLVFQLPSSNGANKTIKNWLKRAKIERKITWHNARHSFGTNLILNEVDVLTTSELMGHTTLQQVKRYVKAASELKQRATDKINIEL